MRSESIRARVLTVFVLVAVALASVACTQAAGTTSQGTTPAATTPQPKAPTTPSVEVTSVAAEVAATAPAPKPKMTAKQVASKRCNGCHSVSTAMSYRTSKAGSAKAMIKRMESRGASLSAEERAVLVDYYIR